MGGSRTELLDTFLKLGYLSPASLAAVKGRGDRQGIPAVEAALLSGVLHPDAKGWILSKTLGIPFLEVDPGAVPLSLSELVPEAVARENLAVPVSRDDGRLTLAVADPFRHEAFARIEEMTGQRVRLVICSVRAIADILDRFYPDSLPLPADEISGGRIGREEAREWLARGRGRGLAKNVVLHAVRQGLSTVRICPSGRNVVVEGDAEGRKTILLSFPLRRREAVAASFRDLAGISSGSAAEATFQLETETGIRAFRISVLKGLSGQETIVKVLPDLRSAIALDSIGFSPDQIEVTRRLLSTRNGLFLVSSPGTGGIATTIFAMLRETFRAGSRVVTVEESHAFRNDGYLQLERQEADRQFGGKWTTLAERLEPDALMIERVADRQELLDLIHIARRGVPVFCGVGAINIRRALQILFAVDADPFILARVVQLVMHLRLVDLLCPDCRRAVPAVPSLRLVDPRYRERLDVFIRGVSFYVHAGCPRCRGTGYSGKMALFDLLPFTPGVQNMVLDDAPLEERLARIVEDNLQSAIPSAEDLLRRGLATFDDVLPFFR